MSDSIREVLKTLVEAIMLVVIVIFIFLQTWRSTIIPTITIPVSLVGAFAFRSDTSRRPGTRRRSTRSRR